MLVPTRPAAFALVLVASCATTYAAGSDLRLIQAVRDGDDQAVHALLASHADVNGVQPDGATALHWAVERDNLAIAEALLKAGAKVSAANDYGVTPVVLAAANGSAPMIERLLAAGADVNAALPTGETVLMTASRTGKVEAVRTLLAHGAQPDARESVKGQTALQWAIWQGHLEVVKALLNAGASPTLASNSGFTPLLFGVREGNLEALRLLIDKGASVNERAKDGNAALHVAVVRGHVGIAKFLLDRGADPNADGPGYSALHWVAGTWESIHSHDYIFNDVAVNTVSEWSALAGIPSPADKAALIEALIAKGSDVNTRSAKAPPRFGFSLFKGSLVVGATPFYLACLTSDMHTMKLLLANGADPSIPSRDGSTPLIVASGLARVPNETRVPEERVLQSVEMLLSLGNDIHATNAAGNTALHAATMAGLDEVVKYLVSRGAQINARNKEGATPLKLANGFVDAALLNVRPSTAAVLKSLGGTE